MEGGGRRTEGNSQWSVITGFSPGVSSFASFASVQSSSAVLQEGTPINSDESRVDRERAEKTEIFYHKERKERKVR
jgi:hypothetical protein